MSEPKRWKETESWGFSEWDCMAVMEECENGDYVLYSDYARLKAEVERLKAENENAWGSARTYSRLWIEAKENKERLEAEVERLRASSFVTAVPVEQYERVIKAGDKLVEAIQEMDVIIDMDSEHPEVNAWNAAKEGKQS